MQSSDEGTIAAFKMFLEVMQHAKYIADTDEEHTFSRINSIMHQTLFKLDTDDLIHIAELLQRERPYKDKGHTVVDELVDVELAERMLLGVECGSSRNSSENP